MYLIREKAKKLSESISFYCNKGLIHPDNKTALADDTDWGASHFYAEVLHQAVEGEFYCITYDKLQKIQKIFQEETGHSIDIESLIEKDWLRIVYGMVQIPSVIRAGSREAKKVEEMKAEIRFLLQTQTNKESINKIEFEALVKDYEEKENLTLNLKQALTYHLYQEKDGVIKSNNPGHYKPVLDHLTEFKFIGYVYDYMYSKENENKMRIEKNGIQKIITSHKKVFPKTPELKELIASKKIEKNETHFILCFRNEEVSDKTAALLWEKLLEDSFYSSDAERMIIWYNRIIHRASRWCNIGTFSRVESLKRFIEAAHQIVINDPDLSAGEREYQKLKLDQHHGRLYYLESGLVGRKEEFPVSIDLYELYRDLSILDKEYQGELLYMQSVRNPLTYFIHQIVENDFPNGESYPTIFKLINSNTIKPYILWMACFVIYDRKQAIIPFLLLNTKTASLGLELLSKAKISDLVSEGKDDIKLVLLKSGFELILGFINGQPLIEEEKAKIIFQCLFKTFVKKFKIPAGQDINRQNKEKEYSVKTCEQLKDTFYSSQLPGVHYDIFGNHNQLLFPGLLPALFELIKKYEAIDYLKNHTISLPFAELDFLAWLLHLRLSKEYNRQITGTNDMGYHICETIVESYSNSINCIEIDGWDYTKNSIEKKLPSWHSYQNFNDLIRWNEILLALEQQNLSEDFINPKQLELEKATDKYNNYNRFTGEKIRTHLSILLTCYNKLYVEQASLRAKKLPVIELLDKLENKITFYITQYCIDEPAKKRIDIFDDLFERTYWGRDKEELLPIIGYSMNKFKEVNKRKIITELITTHQLIRSLKLLEYVISEKDREILLSLINKQNITSYLETLTSIKEVQFVMQELAQSEGFYEKAAEALAYWENRILKGKRNDIDEYKIIAFRIKLLLAYHTGDEKNIVLVEDPQFQYGSIQRSFSAIGEKGFYEALIFLKKKEPFKAYTIFNNQLNGSSEDRPTLALNRFASKLQLADETANIENKKKLYAEAIEEWNEFEQKLSQDVPLQYIKEKIWHNKLNTYSHLENNKEFDVLYNQLEKTMQLRNDFLELRISNLVQRNMHLQAEKLLVEAEEYHQLSDGTLPDFIYSIRKITDTKDTQLFLQEQYNRIFSKSPEELIKIIPSNLNGSRTMPDFILNELTGAANDMLTYINSISAIDYEDKYSDLMILALNSRLRIYSWHVGNARGGYSDSYKPNPGEIDFAIFTKKEKLAICEAMILKGKNTSTTQRHQFKIFNYDHSRKLFYIITYYKGKGDQFNTHWKQYKDDIASVIEFPTQFKLKRKTLEDLSKTFGNNSIKVGKGKHAGDVELYHIFINIDYKVEE